MSEERFIVPEGMLKAAIDASGITNHITIAKAVKAVLGWLSKNPIVPTEEQATALFASIEHPVGATGEGWGKVASDIAVEWQRRCFLAPEPEVMLYREIEIGWRGGLVTAGPFIRENATWTPEQAEKIAEYLKVSAQKAREQKSPTSEPEVPEGWPDGCVHGTEIQRPLCNSCRQSFEAYRRGQKSKEEA